MPRKKFEEEPYEPVKAELLQTVAALGRAEAIGGGIAAAAPGPSAEKSRLGSDGPPVGRKWGGTSAAPSRDDAHREPVLPRGTAAESHVPQSELAEQTAVADEPTPLKEPEEDKPTKRFQVTADEDYELREFIHRLQRRSGSKVSLSTITRAILTVAMRAEEALNAEVDKVRPIPQPSNNDPEALARFEERWVVMLGNAFRKMRPLW